MGKLRKKAKAQYVVGGKNKPQADFSRKVHRDPAEGKEFHKMHANEKIQGSKIGRRGAEWNGIETRRAKRIGAASADRGGQPCYERQEPWAIPMLQLRRES